MANKGSRAKTIKAKDVSAKQASKVKGGGAIDTSATLYASGTSTRLPTRPTSGGVIVRKTPA